MKNFLCMFALLGVGLSASGCFESEPGCPVLTPDEVDPAGDHVHYVVNRLEMPTTASLANQLGLNLDGDEQGRPDNALGQILSTLGGQSGGTLGLDEEVAQLIDAGALLHLLDIQARSLTDATGVGVTVRHGLDTDGDPTDNFDGDEVFGIDASRGEGLITGVIEQGHLSVDLGSAPLAVTFPGLGEPFVVQLSRARIEATITPDGIEGTLGGGISKAELDATLVPIFFEGISRLIARDCDEDGCTAGSFGGRLLGLFDEDLDGAIDLEEFRHNSVVESLGAPDIDLLYGTDGPITPRCDGVKDHLSIGIGFSAVPARLAN